MTKAAELFCDSRCLLGEGPLWHHQRGELFWFDIYGKLLYSAGADGVVRQRWAFGSTVSAAAIVDHDRLLVAAAGQLWHLNLDSGDRRQVSAFEADKPGNRSNDGRVDPSGGFWIGSMSDTQEVGAGAVYQYRAGRLQLVFDNITISNAICFSPDGTMAYFSDTPTGTILKCPIDRDSGLPAGDWVVFAEKGSAPGHPDGAVVDSEGHLWNARWGGSCVVRYAPDGKVVDTVAVPSANVSCPAFGGADLTTLYLTTARSGLNDAELAAQPHAGSVFAFDARVSGQRETAVLL